jgi:hypothetical protein
MDEYEKEARRILASSWISPEERRLLRKALIFRHGREHYKKERLKRMSTEQLLNNWVIAAPDDPHTLIDMSNMPDMQLLKTLFSVTETDDKCNSAIYELAKRANNQRLTVASYIRLKGRPPK